MMHDSVQRRSKRLWVLPFAQNMGKNMGKNMSKKYSQKFVDHTKQSATDAHKTVSKRAIQKLS